MSKELNLQDARRAFKYYLVLSLIFTWIAIGLTAWLAATSTGTIAVLDLTIPGIFAGSGLAMLAIGQYFIYYAWGHKRLHENRDQRGRQPGYGPYQRFGSDPLHRRSYR